MTDNMTEALAALRANVEAVDERNGVQWGTVYLDNAKPRGWPVRKWAGVLGALAGAGLYRDIGDCFGAVQM